MRDTRSYSLKEVQQKLQQLKEELGKMDQLDLAQCWERLQLAMSLEAAARYQQANELHQEAISLRTQIRLIVERQAENADPALVDEFLNERHETLLLEIQEQSDDIQTQIKNLYRIRDEILWLIRLSEKRQGIVPENPLTYIEEELERLDEQIRQLEKQQWDTKTVKLDKIHCEEELLTAQIEDLTRIVEQNQNYSPQEWFLVFQRSHHLQRSAKWALTMNCQQERSAQKLKNACQLLEQKQTKLLEYLHPQKEEFKSQCLELFLEYANGLKVKVEEMPLQKAVATLHYFQKEIQEAYHFLPQDEKTKAKKLKKLEKYARTEAMEKALQHRLENIFGYRFVSFFENLILFLILAVIALMVVEETVDLTLSQRLTLMWTDVGICAIFLLEFFTKLFLSNNKFLYFKNHFLFDFLPSIPFSLLTLAEADVLRAGRLARLGRLTRMLRYIRVARPFVRLFRLFLLLVRILDRAVKQYSSLLNKEIVIFSQKPFQPKETKNTLEKLFQLQQTTSRRIWLALQIIPEKEKLEILQWRILRLHLLLDKTSLGEGKYRTFLDDKITKNQAIQEVSLESIIYEMTHMDANKVQEILGRHACLTAARYLKLFNVPIVRKLPLIRKICQNMEKLNSFEITAQTGREIGLALQKILEAIYYLADFHGIVTAPQLLDRVGKSFVKATQRPAIRLIILGTIFFLLQGLAHLIKIPALIHATSFLSQTLGTPIIILGILCAVPLALGYWFLAIAGQASFFYDRVAEAQYINLLKELKIKNSQRDLNVLYKRVLQGEELERDTLYNKNDFFQLVAESANIHTNKKKSHHIFWEEAQRITLLYRDYLDGATLHHSDVKTCEQLLGNLTIDGIKRFKLKYSKKELKQLENLDLKESKRIFGPYIWFHFITHSLAQRSARLLVEYNQNCFPLSDLPHLSPEEKTSMQAWLERKKNPQPHPPTTKEIKQISNLYRTTEFNALYFLSKDPQREKYIQQQFGQDIYHLLCQDRKAMFRDIFGSYPLHHLPKKWRVLNPFQLYSDYCSQGKIFLLPVYFLYLGSIALKLAIKKLLQAIRDILHPNLTPLHFEKLHSGFHVAVRKINRMRKPIYMEILKMRALFDHEYLAIPTPTYPLPFEENIEDDLNFISATFEERQFFEQLIQQREKSIQQLKTFLEEEKLLNKDLENFLLNLPNGRQLVSNKYRILRNLTIAYLINSNQLATHCHEYLTVKHFFLDSLHKQNSLKPTPPLFASHRKKQLFENITNCLSITFPKQTQKYQTMRAFLKNKQIQHAAQNVLKFNGLKGILETIRQICQHWHIWNEELLTLRTLQTLSVMDIQNYREIVHQMGEYP